MVRRFDFARRPLLFWLASCALAVACCGAEEWRPVSGEELAMKEHPQEAGGGAMILFREGYLKHALDNSFQDVYTRIKIFNDAGKEEANVQIPYIKGIGKIDGIKARTIKPDGSIVELKKSQIFDKILIKTKGLRMSAKTFFMPDVESGSIIEYKYRVSYDSPITFLFSMRWDFQKSIFCKESKVTISSLPGLDMYHILHNTGKATLSPVKTSKGYEFVMKNVPALKDEPFMPPEDEVKLFVDFLYRTQSRNIKQFWEDYAKKRWQTLEDYLKKNKNVRAVTGTLVRTSDTAEQKIEKIYHYVRTEIKNLSYRTEPEEEVVREKREEINNADDVVKYKYGRSRDVNRLFVAMLRAANLEAYVAEVCTRDDKFFKFDIPATRQFDGEIAAVKSGDKYLYFDPGTPYCPRGMLSWEKENTSVLVLVNKGGEFLDTPLTEYKNNVTRRDVKVKLKENGVIDVAVEESFAGHPGLVKKNRYDDMNEEKRKREIEAQVKKRVSNAVLNQYAFENVTKANEDLKIKYGFHAEDYAVKTGSRLLVAPAVLNRASAGILGSSAREYPVYFKYPEQEMDTVLIEVPQDYEIEELPRPIIIQDQFGAYGAEFTKVDNKVLYKRTFILAGIYFKKEYYPRLKTFYDRVHAADQTQIVLRAKKRDRSALGAADRPAAGPLTAAGTRAGSDESGPPGQHARREKQDLGVPLATAGRWERDRADEHKASPYANGTTGITSAAPDDTDDDADAAGDKDAPAVVLSAEAKTTVNKKGDTNSYFKKSIKILKDAGKRYATIPLQYDDETKIYDIKVSNKTPDGRTLEAKNENIIETQLGDDLLYSDVKSKLITVPGVRVGSVITYEYKQKKKEMIFQDLWRFQQRIPVMQSRFTLELPEGWEFKYSILNHPDVKPVKTGANSYAWEMKDLSAIRFEPEMPPIGDLSPTLVIGYFSGSDRLEKKSLGSWSAVSEWYTGLAAPQMVVSAEMRAKTQQLTAGLSTKPDKIRAVGKFVQEASYCAIELGIGKYKPHAADAVFRSRCGDCKDKATLMRAMLREAGIAESYHVLIRGKASGRVNAEFPSPFQFNHCIVGVPLKKEEWDGPVYAVKDDILFFDPTHPLVPVGFLPGPLQGVNALVVNGGAGKLMTTPSIPEGANMIVRSARVKLRAAEPIICSYVVQETFSGLLAAERRAAFLHKSAEEQKKLVEGYLAKSQPGAVLQEVAFDNLPDLNKALVITLKFHAPRCADRSGSLLLFSPKVLGGRRAVAFVDEKRNYPIAFDYRYRAIDQTDVEIPPGYALDELPANESMTNPFLAFKAVYAPKVGLVTFSRHLSIKETDVPPDHYKEVRTFFGKVRNSDLSKIVLKAAPAGQ